MPGARAGSPGETPRPNRVAVDANLWALLVAGTYNPLYIERSRRARAYTADHFNELSMALTRFATTCATPHVLAEVSNLIRQEPSYVVPDLWAAFRALMDQVVEVHVPSAELSASEHAPRLGWADMSIARLARDGCLILTADAELAAFLWAGGDRVQLMGPSGFSGL